MDRWSPAESCLRDSPSSRGAGTDGIYCSLVFADLKGGVFNTRVCKGGREVEKCALEMMIHERPSKCRVHTSAAINHHPRRHTSYTNPSISS